MKESRSFYTPTDMEQRKLYPEAAEKYKIAFGGDPWFEVSECADQEAVKRCAGGFSSLPLGALCLTCENFTQKPAYDTGELVERFRTIASSRPTAWYSEANENGTTLFGLAWMATPQSIAEEKYADVPAMQPWMRTTLGDEPIMWIDEVFADRTLKPKGNLANFGTMCQGLADTLGATTIAYRTIATAMTTAPVRDFGEQARVFKQGLNVPDRRDFVIIALGGNK